MSPKAEPAVTASSTTKAESTMQETKLGAPSGKISSKATTTATPGKQKNKGK
jgi:hypothetical protein